MRIHQQTDDEEQRPVRHSFCRSVQREPHLKCLTLTLLIAISIAATAWCRIAVVALSSSASPSASSGRSPFSASGLGGQCQHHSGYVYLPLSLFCLLYFVYLGECWHCSTHVGFRFPVGASAIYQQIRAMRLSPPIVWWRAVCYHYDRRLRQVMRYRRGDAYASSQVFYERINSQLTTTVFDYTRFGVVDASKRLVHLEKHPATKIRFSRKFSFSCRAAEESYRQQRTEFLEEHHRVDDYLEFTEGLDLLNVRFQDDVTALSNPHRRPWYLHRWAFWTASVLLLSYPFRLLVGARTAHVHYTVHKIFGVDRGPEFVTRILVPDPVLTVNRNGELETAIRHNLSLAPSYAEAVQQPGGRVLLRPEVVVADFRRSRGGGGASSIPLVSLAADRNSSVVKRLDQRTSGNGRRKSSNADDDDDDARDSETSSSPPCAAGSGDRSGGHVTTHRNSVVIARVEAETPDTGQRTSGQRSSTGRRRPEGESDRGDDDGSLSSGVAAVSGARRLPVQLPSGDDDDGCKVRRTGSGVCGRISVERRRDSEKRDANGDRKNQVTTSGDGILRVETDIKRTSGRPSDETTLDASRTDQNGGAADEAKIIVCEAPSGERPSPVVVSIRVNPLDYLNTTSVKGCSPKRSSFGGGGGGGGGEQTVAAGDEGPPASPSSVGLAGSPSPILERRSPHGDNNSAEASDNRAAEEERGRGRGEEEVERELPGRLNFVSEFPPSYEDALRMRPFVEPRQQQQQQHGSEVDEYLADSSDDSAPEGGHCDDGSSRSRSRTAMIIEIMETSL